MYSNEELIKSFKGSSAILPYTVVKFGADDLTVANATAVSDLAFGVANELGLSATDITNGALVDIVVAGIAEVRVGAAVTRGQKLTVDASGQAVPAAPAAGTNNQIIGIALKSGAFASSVGDVIPVLLIQSVMQG
jgi:hypothetical protein